MTIIVLIVIVALVWGLVLSVTLGEDFDRILLFVLGFLQASLVGAAIWVIAHFVIKYW